QRLPAQTTREFSSLLSSKTPVVNCRRPSLELEPQRELDVACPSTAGRHDRFGDDPRGLSCGFRKWSQVLCSTTVYIGIGKGEIGMVEDVEEFRAELNL